MKLHDRVLIRKYIIINILLVGIFVVSFVLKFRIARDYMPLAKIGEVIGYSQYFGYPFLLDTLIGKLKVKKVRFLMQEDYGIGMVLIV